MILKSKVLEKFTMRAKDGELGSIDDFYFESDSFTVRYFIGDTRTWFFGGKVLLSPESFTEVHIADESISVNATKEQIKDSPKPDEKAPITRQYEKQLSDYYGWGAPLVHPNRSLLTGDAVAPVITPNQPLTDQGEAEQFEQEKYLGSEEQHLQSVNDVRGYKVHTRTGEVGKVSDFLLEKDSWEIRYLEIDVGGFLSKELVLISADWITEISWYDKTITVNVEKDLIEQAPEYHEDIPLSRSDEARLFTHYGRPPYWDNDSDL